MAAKDYDDKKVDNGLTERERETLPVPGFEDEYAVDASGSVYSLPRVVQRKDRGGGSTFRVAGKKMKPTLSADGHLYVTLCKDGVRRRVFVHQIVLEAFVGPCPEGMECLHGPGGPADNRIENIRWGTRSENVHDRKRDGVRLNQHQGKTHCKRGHEYTPDNTYVSQGFRSCKTCKREAKVNA